MGKIASCAVTEPQEPGNKKNRVTNLGVSHSGFEHRYTCDRWVIATAKEEWKKELFIEEDSRCFEEEAGLALSTGQMNGFDSLVCEWKRMTLVDANSIPRFRRHPTKSMRKGGTQLVPYAKEHELEGMAFPLQGCIVKSPWPILPTDDVKILEKEMKKEIRGFDTAITPAALEKLSGLLERMSVDWSQAKEAW